MTTNAIVKAEPLKISGSHADREARAQALANAAVGAVRQFVTDHIDDIVQVRQDFWEIRKDKSKLICGVHGFEEYCDGVLHFSASYIRSLIPAGKNPASAIHDGSKNHKPEAALPSATTEPTLAASAKIPEIEDSLGARSLKIFEEREAIKSEVPRVAWENGKLPASIKVGSRIVTDLDQLMTVTKIFASQKRFVVESADYLQTVCLGSRATPILVPTPEQYEKLDALEAEDNALRSRPKDGAFPSHDSTAKQDDTELLKRQEVKKIKKALGIPLRQPLPAEIETAYKKGYDRGYSEGFADGQEAQLEHDTRASELLP